MCDCMCGTCVNVSACVTIPMCGLQNIQYVQSLEVASVFPESGSRCVYLSTGLPKRGTA